MLSIFRQWIFRGFLTHLFLLPFAASSAQTFSAIHHINCDTDGCSVQQPTPITQGRDGNL